MADIRINKDTGEIAIPEADGGYRIYKRDEYRLDADNNRVAIPDARGFVMYDLPAPERPMFTARGTKRALALGTRQSIEGLATPLTMVGDAINATLNLPLIGINKLAGTNIPLIPLPSQELNETLVQDAGFPTEENDTERLLAAINKGGTGAAVTLGLGSTGALAANAPRAAAALRTAPIPQTIGAMTGSAAAEGARQGLQDIQISDSPTLDAVTKSFLQLAAGVVGGVGGFGGAQALNTAARGAGGTLLGIADAFTTSGREKIAGQVLRQASGDPNSLAARLSDIPPSRIPGVRPTTAQALGGDSQLSSLELAMRNAPDTRYPFDIRAAENQAARTASLDALIPAGSGSVDDLANGIRQAWAQADDAGRQEILAAQQRAQQRLAALGDTVDPQAAGQVIREELAAAYQSARGQTSAAYQAIDPTNATSLSGRAVFDRVAPLIQQNFANSTLGTPRELLPILERLRNSPDLPLSQLDGIRQDLGNIAGQAARAGDNRLASVAGQMADEIGAYADDAAQAGQGFTPQQAQAYQAARDLRREQGQTFERGAVGATTKRGPYGEYKVAESGVPAELFFRGGGSPEAAQQFIRAAGGRPRALKAAQDYLATTLRQNVTRPDGSIDPASLARFQQEYSGTLSQFPELRGRIADLGGAQGVVDQATLAQSARQTEMAGSPLNQFLTKNPTDAVNAILMSKNSEGAAQRIIEQLRGNSASLSAFKRSVIEWFQGKIQNAGVQPVSGDPLQSYAKVKAILDSKLPTLQKIFNRDEIQALRDFGNQMATENRVTSAKPLGSNTFNNFVSRYLVERGSAGYAPMMGASPIANIPGLSLLTRNLDEQIRANLVRALINPSDAGRMVGMAVPLPIRDAGAGVMSLLRGAGVQSGIQGQAEMNRQHAPIMPYVRHIMGWPMEQY